MDMKVQPLSSRAILVKLTMRRPTTTRRDAIAELKIQRDLDDSSLTVLSKLFRDKGNAINRILAAANEVYTYHREHTLPWVDAGPRVVPSAVYMEYAADMRAKIAKVEALVNEIDDQVYAACVHADMMSRGARASAADYPTLEKFKESLGFDLRPMPIPDTRHFLFDIPAEDEEAFARSLDEATELARVDTVKRMLEPLKHLAAKLQVPIGDTGAVFRDSALENVIEGIEIARKLNLDDNEELAAITQELEDVVNKCATFKESLRISPMFREQQAAKLAQVQSKMAAFMGAL